MQGAEHLEWIYATAIGGIAVLLVTSTVFILLTRRLRQPPVIAEITAGICLGPSLLGLLPGDLTERLFPREVRPFLSIIAQVGVVLFMFVVGWELDGKVLRGRGRRTGFIWFGSVALPIGLGLGLALALYDLHDTVNGRTVRFADFAMFLGVALSVAAFPVLARLLTEHGIHRRPIGSYALAIAALDDIFAWSMLAFVSAMATTQDIGELPRILGWGALYLAVMWWVVRPGLARIVPLLGSRAFSHLPALIAAGVFASAYTTSMIGLHAIFGAFMFGVVMPRGGDQELIRRSVLIPLENAGKLLLPVFFVVTGLSVDLTSITGSGLLQLLAIILVACGAKLGAVLLFARLSGMTWRDSTALGVLLNTRGLTELVVLNVGYALGLLSTELFTLLVLMALITTAMTSPIITLMLRRSPQETAGDGELLGAAPSPARPGAAGGHR